MRCCFKKYSKHRPVNKNNIFSSFIIDQSWNTLQLKNIVLSFHPPFEPITALFTFSGLWPLSFLSYELRHKKTPQMPPLRPLYERKSLPDICFSLIQCIVEIYAGIATWKYVDIYNRVCQVPSFILVIRSINKILTWFKEHNSVINLHKKNDA